MRKVKPPTPEEYEILLKAYAILNEYAKNGHLSSWEELSINSSAAAESIRKSFYYITSYFDNQSIQYSNSFDVIKSAIDKKLGKEVVRVKLTHPYPSYEIATNLQDYYATLGYRYFNIINLPYGEILIVMEKRA